MDRGNYDSMTGPLRTLEVRGPSPNPIYYLLKSGGAPPRPPLGGGACVATPLPGPFPGKPAHSRAGVPGTAVRRRRKAQRKWARAKGAWPGLAAGVALRPASCGKRRPGGRLRAQPGSGSSPSRLPSPRVARFFSALRDGAGPRRYWGRRGCQGLGAGLGPAAPGAGCSADAPRSARLLGVLPR